MDPRRTRHFIKGTFKLDLSVLALPLQSQHVVGEFPEFLPKAVYLLIVPSLVKFPLMGAALQLWRGINGQILDGVTKSFNDNCPKTLLQFLGLQTRLDLVHLHDMSSELTRWPWHVPWPPPLGDTCTLARDSTPKQR